MADGATCRTCKGSGEITCGPSYTTWFEVEWSKDDLSDLEVMDGDPIECEACGHDFMEDIKEELLWLRENENKNKGYELHFNNDSFNGF